MPHAQVPSLNIPDHPQCDPQKIRIIHVGMGAAGMLCAYKAKKMLTNYELVCYEKNSVPGGTWYENRYPGCACDIPAHTYTLPFHPNPNWSSYYAYAPEIQEYLMDFYKHHNLHEFIKLNTEVLNAQWDDLQGLWNVELKNVKDGSTFRDTCNVLINGSGALTKWKWPKIEGLHDFKGVLAHSANWPQELDWSGKRVAVIGSGSSSIQMVPQFAKTASKLTVFLRNQTYIAAQFGANVTNTEADPEAMDPAAAGKHQYTEKEKQRFRDDPAYLTEYRTKLERSIVGGWNMFIRGSELNVMFKEFTQNQMKTRLGERDDLKELMIPTWSPGCRRLTPGEGYLEALGKENVEVVWGEIEKSQEIEVDILACATGFDVQYLPHFKITGLGGQIMQDQTAPNVYASITSPGFPNYFVIGGPRGNWAQGTVFPSHETQMVYVIQCCRKMQEDQIKSMHPKQHITIQLNAYLDTWHTKYSIWAEPCKSWYKAKDPHGQVMTWAGSLLHLLKFLKRPRYEHYEIEYRDPDNVFAFLGNGTTIGQVRYGAEVPVPYIRDGDGGEWDIE
ncbi:hypothetical protein M409DRAFT_20660 [Zasmidium cellare ATCC 36951]|uniref:L-ornithine N(5)-oxygenase n=1 Tax=Zasmidium cellare ATCC 36951 TaxID=1080233 RepID=A0A6A6CQU1_ZASCE|nr:uncharacterized protein M409DRAFT_20660 [Zasmidium cellare ATCC 36951]KAF2169441.1 hypothetical protein M409DRAFT_20660 [Zasmidium cellare ATCC 36951]